MINSKVNVLEVSSAFLFCRCLISLVGSLDKSNIGKFRLLFSLAHSRFDVGSTTVVSRIIIKPFFNCAYCNFSDKYYLF